MKKISVIIFVIILLISTLVTPVIAETMDISDITKPATVPGNVKEDLDSIWDKAWGIISVIGAGVAAIMLIVIAIKYMSAAPNERAEIKKYFIIYAVGAIFIFCCVGIVNLLKGVAEDILL